jgi:hypothetical protein
MPANNEAPRWPQVLRRLPKRSNLTPPINERSGGAPLKPTNSSELGQEPLNDGPNEGPPPKLGTLLVPQPMAVEGRP